MTDKPHDRRALAFSDEQIDLLAEKLAERVAQKAFEQFTGAVGRSVVRNVLVIIAVLGAAVAGILKWHDRI